MKRGGYFIERVPGRDDLEIKNTLVKFGAESFLRDIFRKETTLLANTWYLGVTNLSYNFDTSTLADIAAGEPVGNGYARQALGRGTVDWTVDEINGVMRAISKTCVFTASANWDKNWLRIFLCDAAAGTVGNLIALSGPAPAPRTVLSGAGPSLAYTFFLRG